MQVEKHLPNLKDWSTHVEQLWQTPMGLKLPETLHQQLWNDPALQMLKPSLLAYRGQNSVAALLSFFLCHSAFGILVPWPGIEPMSSAVTMPSPNYWTPKEVPSFAFLLSAQLIHFLIFALSYILNKIIYKSMIETQIKLILFDFYLYSREKIKGW